MVVSRGSRTSLALVSAGAGVWQVQLRAGIWKDIEELLELEALSRNMKLLIEVVSVTHGQPWMGVNWATDNAVKAERRMLVFMFDVVFCVLAIRTVSEGASIAI